jgi:hypothetical protein
MMGQTKQRTSGWEDDHEPELPARLALDAAPRRCSIVVR